VRWAFWLGSVLTVGGLWWLFQAADLTGQTDQVALGAAAALFLLGMVLMGWGIGARDGPD
jgi:hypothetical protein